ncbi:hypothetical protein BD309DRAFT_910291 [Dichomitus squalens]|uniref:Uncharacterized protein n=1 Tax=Dichomitus squalens TaxID=114155 RepID=A0A4Q9MW33_9APHY|nr:uncharacterized protein DICSQDRAFT_160058 [Dichomitus squalens LYAD-421 SS1]EJF64213.1 hypothetical protein DICSQDRAFT_160058 [Dichomitus squalens LYAD-421 SS1]TBU30691.1 hypothetical protein BD311DRAFT_718209 [Dichomitus squalens]TBU49189.1 hypothetical protein BD309DRAFT_910291 [Dichomitus squalens]TBU60945.1 hypothetical protein BD310DRAFT_957305 [Dichomitus squalens]
MSAPVAQEELPILEAVINIRNRLTALKKNRGEFIKPSDVYQLYQMIVKQVTRLNEVRDDHTTYNNRLDTTLADVFNLLSLFFLTIGKTRECPATYSQVASMRGILDHMDESGVYNESDLAPFHRRLAELRNILQADVESGKHPPAMTKLLERQLNECDNLLRKMQDSLAVLSPELIPIHERLVNIRRQLVALAAKETAREVAWSQAKAELPDYKGKAVNTEPEGSVSEPNSRTPTRESTPTPRVATAEGVRDKDGLRVKAELKPIQEELRKIDSKRVDGKFLGPGGSVPASQAICSSLLEECFEIVQEIRAQDESKNVASSLRPIYDRLSEIRKELEQLVLTHRWSLRETDLWNYSLSLQEIDKMRVDGKFVDADGNRPEGQYVLLYLLRRCYGLIYRLLSSSEPVSEELMPIANKLSTVKKCLNEVLKYGGPFSPRDLYPYQLALHQIDSMRKDGKFIGVDGSIPEGQGIVMAHLNECHELLEMLKESMEVEEDDYIDGDDYEFDDPPSEEEDEQ